LTFAIRTNDNINSDHHCNVLVKSLSDFLLDSQVVFFSIEKIDFFIEFPPDPIVIDEEEVDVGFGGFCPFFGPDFFTCVTDLISDPIRNALIIDAFLIVAIVVAFGIQLGFCVYHAVWRTQRMR